MIDIINMCGDESRKIKNMVVPSNISIINNPFMLEKCALSITVTIVYTKKHKAFTIYETKVSQSIIHLISNAMHVFIQSHLSLHHSIVRQIVYSVQCTVNSEQYA